MTVKDFVTHTMRAMNHNQTRASAKATKRVGFYGCANQVVRVRVALEANQRPPQHAMVDCPACGHRHGASSFMWRKPHSMTEWESSEAEVTT